LEQLPVNFRQGHGDRLVSLPCRAGGFEELGLGTDDISVNSEDLFSRADEHRDSGGVVTAKRLSAKAVNLVMVMNLEH
jgi:hypothetical protein